MSAKAPPPSASNGPMVDTGVYRYERNRRSHEFFSPGPHRCYGPVSVADLGWKWLTLCPQ